MCSRFTLPLVRMETLTRDKCATIDDINRVCDLLRAECERKGITRNVYREMEYYGNVAPPELRHNNIEVRRDQQTGQRVFATARIPAHTIVTFFPVHAMGLHEHIKFSDSDTLFFDRIERYALTHARYIRPLSAAKSEGDESTPKPEYSTVLVVGNPNNVSDTRLLGHAIHDACGINVFGDTAFEMIKDWTTFRNKVATYYITSAKRHNCFFVTNNLRTLIGVETTRDIEPGEELLIMLGPEYWFRRKYIKKDEHNFGDYLFDMLTQDAEFNEWREKLYRDK